MLAFRMMFVLVSKDRGSDVNKLKINTFDEFDPNEEMKKEKNVSLHSTVPAMSIISMVLVLFDCILCREYTIDTILKLFAFLSEGNG